MANTDWIFAALLLCAYSNPILVQSCRQFAASINISINTIKVRLNKYNWNINRIFDYSFLMRITLIKLNSNSWLKLRANINLIDHSELIYHNEFNPASCFSELFS